MVLQSKDEILSWLLTHAGVESEASRELIYNTLVLDRENKPAKGQKKAFQPPTFKEVADYFVINGYPAELAERAFLGYQDNAWHDSHGQPIRNWRQKMRFVWMKPENKPGHKSETGTHAGQYMNTGNVKPSKF